MNREGCIRDLPNEGTAKVVVLCILAKLSFVCLCKFSNGLHGGQVVVEMQKGFEGDATELLQINSKLKSQPTVSNKAEENGTREARL